MKRIKEINNIICKLKKEKWIKSFFVAALFLLITWLLFSVSYETNDDSAMMYTIAGYRTGQIEVNSVFSSIVWGGIVGGAYRLFE